MRTLCYFLAACVLSSVTAEAASIHFIQNGWSTGATLDVAFSGQDSDGDGVIVRSELTSFNAVWGTSPSDATLWTISSIEPDGFLFGDFDNYLFFIRNDKFSLVSTAFEGEALASVFDEFLFPVDSSATTPTSVPEPVGLTAVGLGAIALWLRRRNGEV